MSLSPPSPAPRPPRILVLAAHPDLRLSRVNRRLLTAARDLAAETEQPDANGPAPVGTMPRVEVRDLYALYPDYCIDVAAEQAAAASADLIVWMHPIHWYAMPPLMKLWLDEVLTLGWAYGPGGVALQGKDLWLLLSTGGTEDAYSPTGYNRYFFDAFLPPYDQTAALCGLRLLPPMVLHGAHAVDEAALDAHVSEALARLRSYPDWPEMADLESCAACVLPRQDRPADDTSDRDPGQAMRDFLSDALTRTPAAPSPRHPSPTGAR